MLRVKAGIFSLTAPAGPDDDGSYLRWHLLDHQPEQYQLPGIAYALRYIADGDYLTSRLASADHLTDVGNVVNYLVSDPVEQTAEDFLRLGAQLAEVGRFPEIRPSLQLRLLGLHQAYAAPQALISPDIVPFRPHRGVVVIVEEPAGDDRAEWASWLQGLHTTHYPEVLSVPGVAGAWMFGATATWKLAAAYGTAPQCISVIYLDEDPLATTAALAPLIEKRWAGGQARPLFAGPLRTMIDWEAWPRG